MHCIGGRYVILWWNRVYQKVATALQHSIPNLLFAALYGGLTDGFVAGLHNLRNFVAAHLLRISFFLRTVVTSLEEGPQRANREYAGMAPGACPNFPSKLGCSEMIENRSLHRIIVPQWVLRTIRFTWMRWNPSKVHKKIISLQKYPLVSGLPTTVLASNTESPLRWPVVRKRWLAGWWVGLGWVCWFGGCG